MYLSKQILRGVLIRVCKQLHWEKVPGANGTLNLAEEKV